MSLEKETQKWIQKNIRSASITVSDLEDAIEDCDIEEAKKQLGYLISQANGLKQLFETCEQHNISLSAE